MTSSSSAEVSGQTTRLQLLCVWAGPVMVVLYLIGFAGISHFVPPPSPLWSAARTARFFAAHRTGIRVGQLVAMITSVLLFPFWAVISVQMARIERRLPVLALIQFGGAVLLQVYFVLCSMLWIGATFRPDLAQSTVRDLNDLAWLVFVMVFPGYTLQLICIAITSFMDHSAQPLWPRWAAYLTLFTAVSGAGGGLAHLYKHGPFAWNGFLGFYFPFATFVIWISVMTYLMHTGIQRQGVKDTAIERAEAAVAAGSSTVEVSAPMASTV